MQPCGDETIKCPGLDHPGQKRNERRKQNDSKKRRKEAGRSGLQHPGQNKQQEPPPPGLEHPGRNKQQEPPPPALGHPGTRDGKTHQSGPSGTEQAGRAAAPQTGSSGDKRRPDAPDCIIRVGSSCRTWRIPDWIIRARTTRSGHNWKGTIIRANQACRPGQDCWGRIKQKESPPPGLQRPKKTDGQRRKEQQADAKVGQRWSHVRRQRKGQRQGNAVMQRRGRGVEETQYSKSKDPGAVKQRNGPMDMPR